MARQRRKKTPKGFEHHRRVEWTQLPHLAAGHKELAKKVERTEGHVRGFDVRVVEDVGGFDVYRKSKRRR